MSFPWLIVGGAAVGVGFLYLRNKQAAQKAPGSDSTDCAKVGELAEKAMPGSGGAAKAACEALKSIDLGAIADSFLHTDADVARDDATNKQLNGAVDVEIGANLAATIRNGNNVPAPIGTVARFANGCVPFGGAPGFSKCAPGTKDMWPDTSAPGAKVGHPKLDGTREEASAAASMTGGAGDAFTGLAIDTYFGTAFPLPHDYAAGERTYWNKGRPLVCKQIAHDDRDGGLACSDRDTHAGAIGSDVTTTNLSCGPNNTAPAGKTWDAGGFWRVLAVGEKPNPGPCAAPVPIPDIAIQTFTGDARRSGGSHR